LHRLMCRSTVKAHLKCFEHLDARVDKGERVNNVHFAHDGFSDLNHDLLVNNLDVMIIRKIVDII
jgi:hypothetical protein